MPVGKEGSLYCRRRSRRRSPWAQSSGLWSAGRTRAGRLRRGKRPRVWKALDPARPPRFIDYGWANWESARALFGATRSELDSFSAFPLVFLYRQAIELFFKGILIDLGCNSGIQAYNQKVSRGTTLSKLNICNEKGIPEAGPRLAAALHGTLRVTARAGIH
jgi:hypothetical protein